jgi:hypothetical protein
VSWRKRKGCERILRDTGDVQTKTSQIEAAGLSIRTANRYEELAAPTAANDLMFAREGPSLLRNRP